MEDQKKKIGLKDIVTFTNWLKEDFVGKWSGESETFAPGQSKLMQAWRANHYAKHLVDQHLNNVHKKTNDFSRQGLMDKCIGIREDSGLTNADNVEAKLLDRNAKKKEIMATSEDDESSFEESKDETTK